LEIAERVLGVPAILSPENLSSPDLDQLSCITYLSYFVQKNGPGYNALLANVQAVSFFVEFPNQFPF
jgi:filamin